MIFFPCRVRNISLGVIQLINAILESNPNKILKQTKNRQLLSLSQGKKKKSHVKVREDLFMFQYIILSGKMCWL